MKKMYTSKTLYECSQCYYCSTYKSHIQTHIKHILNVLTLIVHLVSYTNPI